MTARRTPARRVVRRGDGAATGDVRAGRSPRRAPAGATAACASSSWPPAGRTRSTPARRDARAAAVRVVRVSAATARPYDLAGRRGVFTGPPTSPTCPRDASATVASEAGGRFALPGARATGGSTARYGPAEGVPVELRGAGPGQPAGQQLLHAGVVRGRQADRRRGAHAGGNWSSFPPHKHDEAGPASRGSRRSTTSRSTRRPGRTRGGVRLPARLRLSPGTEIDVLRRGPHRRRGADPARLARPLDGRPRLRPLLPQRHGRARPRTGLADLRRPGARVGPRHLGGPAGRPAPAPDRHQ